MSLIHNLRYLISKSSFTDFRMIPFYGHISANTCVNSLDHVGIYKYSVVGD